MPKPVSCRPARFPECPVFARKNPVHVLPIAQGYRWTIRPPGRRFWAKFQNRVRRAPDTWLCFAQHSTFLPSLPPVSTLRTPKRTEGHFRAILPETLFRASGWDELVEVVAEVLLSVA